MRAILLGIALFWGLCATAQASDSFRVLGRTSLFNNDYLGDGEDRWRSGSYTRSTFFGSGWSGDLSDASVFELRLRGELITPTDATLDPQPGERPFVGVIAAGGAKHMHHRGWDIRAGAETVLIGPQTGVSSFMKEAHRILGFAQPRANRGQLGNDLFPTVYVEMSRHLPKTVARSFELRPFVEAQAGVETYARAGLDIFFGQGISGSLVTRDVVTGHIMTAVSMKGLAGMTPTIGADITRVFASGYLPRSSGVRARDWRVRVRAGFKSHGPNRDVFMGFTWLSPEYEGQPAGQVLGSLAVDHHY